METFRDYLLVCYGSLYPTQDDILDVIITKYEFLIGLHQNILRDRLNVIFPEFPDAEADVIRLIAELQRSLQHAQLLKAIRTLQQ